MDPLIRFFIEIGKLKSLKRRGWMLRGIKDPESVADHAFRVFLLAWLLGRERRLKLKRLLKLALVHSLSAVYIDYVSPYAKLLETKTKKDLLKKHPAFFLRAPVTEKGKIVKKRFEEEKKALAKLTRNLPEWIKDEVNNLWLEFQQKTSKEARFLKAVDRLENLIQALEYKGRINKDLIAPFLTQVGEATDDKQILNFARSVEEYFLKGGDHVRNRKNFHLIRFLFEAGKLKTIKRIGWVYGGASKEETESVAAHSFRLGLMCWFLAARRRFDLEKILKMAMIHDLVIVYTGDITPFDDLISGDLRRDKEILEKWPPRPKGEKERITTERRAKERKALDKLLKDLPLTLRDEILALWFEYEVGFSKDGRFVRQVCRIEKLLQAIEYHVKKIYKPDIDPYWTQLKLLLDDPVLVEFVENVDKSFYTRGKVSPKFVDKLALKK